MNNRTLIPTILGIAVIMLVIGVVFGSVVFPLAKTSGTLTKTETETLPPSTVEISETTTEVTTINVVTSPATSTASSSFLGPVNYTYFVSLWRALDVAVGGAGMDRNYTSIPANTTASLALYKFWYVGFANGSGETSSSYANVPFNQVSGLPVQSSVEEPYPDSVIVVTNATPPSCVMYMLLWTFDFPSSIPGGGEISVNAITGTPVGDISELTQSLYSNCP